MKKTNHKRVAHLFGAIAVITLLFNVSKMEQECSIVENIPDPIYSNLANQHPTWEVSEIADFYMEKRDSLENDLRAEIEFEEYHKN